MLSKINSHFHIEYAENLRNNAIIKNLSNCNKIFQNNQLFQNVIKIVISKNKDQKICFLIDLLINDGNQQILNNFQNISFMVLEEYKNEESIFIIIISDKQKHVEIIRNLNLLEYYLFNKKFKIFFVKFMS